MEGELELEQVRIGEDAQDRADRRNGAHLAGSGVHQSRRMAGRADAHADPASSLLQGRVRCRQEPLGVRVLMEHRLVEQRQDLAR